MEPPNKIDANEDDSGQNDDDDCFFDALEDFPFHNCIDKDLSEPSTSQSTLSVADIPTPVPTLRRRTTPNSIEESNFEDSTSFMSSVTEIRDPKTRYRERRHRFHRDLNEKKETWESVDSSRVDAVGVNESVDAAGEVGDLFSSNLLVFIAGLMIKAIAFQINLFVYFVTAPFSVFHCFYMLIIDPFGAVRRCRGLLLQKIVLSRNYIVEKLSSLMSDWFKDHESMWKLSLRFGWGVFWSVYVCIVLCGLLVFSTMIGGVVMRCLVEEPLQMREGLNFDYTKNSPVAFVPVISCNGVTCDGSCEEIIGNVKSSLSRIIPANHKLQVTVVLTLPESEYNRNLGMFQVRVDFLSANGKTLASKSHPCMLKFKSEAIHALLTFLNVVPLLTGYASESQTLKLKIKGFAEGVVPTSCLKVTIEQRAEFRPGAGIPEIYDASLVLESQLPFSKRIIWNWRRTLFIWTSMVSFVMQLIFILICCRSVILPRSSPRSSPTVENVVRNNPHNDVDVSVGHDVEGQPKHRSSHS